MSWANSRFHTGSRRAADAVVQSLRWHLARQIKDLKETELAQRRSFDMFDRTLVEIAATVLALEAKSRRGGQMVLEVVKMTRFAVEAVGGKEKKPVAGGVPPRQNDVERGHNAGPSGGVVAGRIHSGGSGVTLPGASAKRSRLLPDVLDDRSCAGLKLSLRDRAIIGDWRHWLS